jgi:group I intron endonuclease
MKNVIYKIRNIINNKFYVGSTVNSRVRFQTHRRNLRAGKHQSPHMQAAWNKYGEDCFKFEIIEIVECSENLLAAEQKWLDEHAGKPHCYNWATDASAPMRGKKHTDDTRVKLKDAAQKVPKGEDSILYNVSRTEEVRKKIGDSQRGVKKPEGRKISEEGLAKIKVAADAGHYSHWQGKTHSEQSKDKMSKTVYVLKPDNTVETYIGFTRLRDEFGISIATSIRACKSGKPVSTGIAAGWIMSYEEIKPNIIPDEYKEYPRSRSDAKQLGAKHYFTGTPCANGHIALRKTKGVCIECAKIEGQKSNEKAKLKRPTK